MNMSKNKFVIIAEGCGNPVERFHDEIKVVENSDFLRSPRKLHVQFCRDAAGYCPSTDIMLCKFAERREGTLGVGRRQKARKHVAMMFSHSEKQALSFSSRRHGNDDVLTFFPICLRVTQNQLVVVDAKLGGFANRQECGDNFGTTRER